MTVEGLRLDYAVPPDDLADYITLFYDFSTDVVKFEDAERAGHAQIRFVLAGADGRYLFADGKAQQAPMVHILGPSTGMHHVSIAGPAHIIGMGLTPCGWSAIVDKDASTLVNRLADAAELLDPARLNLRARMIAAADHPARIAELVTFARIVVRAEPGSNVAFMRHVDAWLSGDPSPDMAVLGRVTGLSARQVERKCNALYGAPPKLLARKYRALRAAVALATGQESIADLLARGFYDQSHLIREIKQFTGYTPRQILRQPTLLAQQTMGGRLSLEGQVHPITSAT